MVIVVGMWMVLAADSATFRDQEPSKQLLPFQTLVQDRSSVEQRMFRELQEMLLEAERRRAVQGSWPSVDALRNDGIPPLAFDPTARDVRYAWQLSKAGSYVNYLGIPDRSTSPAWLVLVMEPEPGAPPDRAREDEEHHKLLSGEMLHVSTWMRSHAAPLDRTIRAPQAEGWTQLYAVAPSPTSPFAPQAR
jgi:hypothetical protein